MVLRIKSIEKQSKLNYKKHIFQVINSSPCDMQGKLDNEKHNK